MKYTEAWASIAQQNLNLKRITMVFIALSLTLSVLCLRLGSKDVVVVERGCYSKVVPLVNTNHTQEEIETFLRQAISFRFDSSVQPDDGFLSSEESKLRDQEQKDLKSKNLGQSIIVRSAKEDSDGFLIEADRVVSVGEVRSAFKFNLKAKVESRARTGSNPYGLVLATVKVVKSEVPK